MEQFCLNMASGVVHYKPSLGCVLFGLVQQTLGHSHEPFLTSTSKSGNKGPLSSSHCLLPRDAIDSSCSSALDFYLKLHCLKKKKNTTPSPGTCVRLPNDLPYSSIRNILRFNAHLSSSKKMRYQSPTLEKPPIPRRILKKNYKFLLCLVRKESHFFPK